MASRGVEIDALRRHLPPHVRADQVREGCHVEAQPGHFDAPVGIAHRSEDVAQPHQAGHLRRSRSAEDCCAVPRLEHPAGGQHQHLVGQQRRLFWVVGHEDAGDPVLGEEAVHLASQLMAQRCVERGERLIEQQELGIARKGAGEGHALTLPARELVRTAVGQLDQPESLEPERCPTGCRARAHRELLPDGAVREQAWLLGDVTNGTLRRRRLELAPTHRHPGGRLRAEARQAPQRRRLARPRGAEQGRAPTRRGGGRRQVERADSPFKGEGQLGGATWRWGHRRGHVDAHPTRRGSEPQQGEEHGRDGNGEGGGSERECETAAGELGVGVHRQRERMVGEDDIGPELTEGPEPRQQQPRGDPRTRNGHTDPQECRELAHAERRRHVGVGARDRAEGAARRHDEKRRGDERLRQDDADQAVGEMATEETAERRVRADEGQEEDATDERREGEREQDRHADRACGPARVVGQEVGEGNAQDSDDRRGDAGREHRGPQRAPQPGLAESLVGRVGQVDEEADHGYHEVQHQERRQPRQRRVQPATPQPDEARRASAEGAPLPTSFGGRIATKPDVWRPARPFGPRR